MLNLNRIPVFILLPLFWLGHCLNPAQNDRQPDGARTIVKGYAPVTVLELFTSQGCSSCPPADELLREVTENSDQNRIIGISYHVDYWNYIGWEDPFSRAEYTNRQRAYARKFGDSRVYTPQLVINGKEHLVGSRAAAVYDRLREFSKQPATDSIMVKNMKRQLDTLAFEYEVWGTHAQKNLRAVLVLDARFTQVKKGENRGRGLQNNHIALTEKEVKLHSASGKLKIPIPRGVIPGEGMHLVLLTENSELGITGATRIPLPAAG